LIWCGFELAEDFQAADWNTYGHAARREFPCGNYAMWIEVEKQLEYKKKDDNEDEEVKYARFRHFILLDIAFS
jgi:hypothetical protein